MITVGELMKGQVVTLEEGDTLARAISLFERHRIRHLPVMRGRRLVGLLSQRDVLRCVGSREAASCLAREVMSTPAATVRTTTPVREAIRLMLDKQYGCLPVLVGEELVGILTETDLVRFADRVIEEKDRVSLAAEYT